MTRYDSLGWLTYGDMDVTYGDLDDDHPIGALLTLVSPTETEDDRNHAAHRLARDWFSRAYVFHPNRWRLLEDAFNRERGDRTFQEAWEDLVVPEILAAADPRKGAKPLTEWHAGIRAHLRRAVEKLLLGRTTDAGDPYRRLTDNLSNQPIRTRPGAEKQRDLPTTDRALVFAELRIDALLRLQQLPQEERALLLEYCTSDDPTALSAAHGITPVALRKRIERIRRKVAD